LLFESIDSGTLGHETFPDDPSLAFHAVVPLASIAAAASALLSLPDMRGDQALLRGHDQWHELALMYMYIRAMYIRATLLKNDAMRADWCAPWSACAAGVSAFQ